VLVAGSVAEIIPMPVIGGLILVIGIELVVGRLPDIRLVLRVAPISALAMLITFAATTQLPLHTAILIVSSRRSSCTASKPRNRPSWSRCNSSATATGRRSRSPSAAQATT
jgi:hypothetical protein